MTKRTTKTLDTIQIHDTIQKSLRSLEAVVAANSTNTPENTKAFLVGNLSAHLVHILGSLPASRATVILEVLVSTNARIAEQIAIRR